MVREDGARLDVKIDLARIYTLVQRYEAACDLWTEIVDAIPDNLDFRAEYARSLMLVGSLEDADEQCRQVLDDDHTRSDVMMIRADIAEFSQRPEATVEAMLKLIDDADDAEVRAKLQAIIDVVNSLGASPDDIMAILQALDQAGAIEGELVVI